MGKQQIPWGRITAEFLVIVAGVTIALFADDWRDYRNDRRDEATALQGILEDLGRDSVELEGQFRNMSSDEGAAARLLRSIGEEIPRDSAWGMIRPIVYYSAYEQVRSGYTGLRDSGRLGIIQDSDLKGQIVEYFEVTQPYLWHFYDQWWVAYKEFSRNTGQYFRVIPNPTGDSIRGNSESRFVGSWRDLGRDHEFLFSVEEIGIIASVFRNRISTGLGENSQLQSRIQLELGESSVSSPAREASTEVR